MPIYEYECSSCGHVVEALQKMSDPPLTECPACLDGKLKKRISAPAFQFKGSGFYITDYTDRGKAQASEGEKASASDAKESKPADSSKATETKSSGASTSSNTSDSGSSST